MYLAVQALSAEHSVKSLCEKLKLNRSSYYKWTRREKSPRELENTAIVHELAVLYAEHNGTYGYRRLANEYNERNNTAYNDKRFYRLAQLVGLKSIIRRKRPAHHRSTPKT